MNETVSHGTPPSLNLFMAIYYGLLILGGTVGNILSLVVMSRLGRRIVRHTTFAAWSPKDRYLSNVGLQRRSSWSVFAALAITDTLYLWVNPLRYFVNAVSRVDVRTEFGDWLCKFHTFFTYGSREASTWILCLLTVERFVSAAWPYHRGTRTRRGLYLVAILIVTTMLLLKNGTLLFILKIRPNRKQQPICDAAENSFLRSCFFYTELITNCIIPTAILLICNALLMRIILRSRELVPQTHGACNDGWSTHSTAMNVRRNRAARRHNRVIRLLLPISFLHLVTMTPLSVFSIYEDQYSLKSSGDKRTAIVGPCLSMLASANNGLNFVIYFLTSKHFRGQLKLVLHSLFANVSWCSRSVTPPICPNTYEAPVPLSNFIHSAQASPRSNVI